MRNKALTGAAFASALGGLVALEDMRTTAYLDIVGVPTICAGTTKGVKLGDRYTEEQCWEIAENEFRDYERHVLKVIKQPMNSNEQTAFVWLTVNIGKAGFASSSVAREFNAGNNEQACHAIRLWNKVTVNGRKVVSKGLDNRRKAEEALCLLPPKSSWPSWLPRW